MSYLLSFFENFLKVGLYTSLTFTEVPATIPDGPLVGQRVPKTTRG